MRWRGCAVALVVVVSIAGCYAPMGVPVPSQVPAFSYRIAWPWDASLTYSVGDVVTMPEFAKGGVIYESLRGDNTGIEPPTLVVIEGSIYGKVGGQMWGEEPTPGWEDWWRLLPQGQN